MPACAHFQLREFIRDDEAYHFARTELTAGNVARYHDHDYHEVFWVLRGEGTHVLNGRRRPLAAGGLHLIRPRDRHCVHGSDAAPLRIINVAFPSPAWAALRRRYFRRRPDAFEAPEAQRHAAADARTQTVLAYWAERLADASRPRVVLDGFLMELARLRAAAAAGATPTPVPDWLQRARREIARPEHFAGGTPAFARLAGRTPSHVARATVRWLGRTPTALVNDARLDHCARQLAETNRPIVDIMLDCGLNNVSHFYALFRRRFGASPRRYRLQAHPTVRG